MSVRRTRTDDGLNPGKEFADGDTAVSMLPVASETHLDFTRVFRLLVLGTGVLIMLASVTMIYGSLFAPTPLAKAMVTRSLQIAIANISGITCVYLGVVLCWFGVKEAVRVSARVDGPSADVRGVLNSAGPGLALAFGGLVLIGLALYRPVAYQEEVIEGTRAKLDFGPDHQQSAGSGQSAPTK